MLPTTPESSNQSSPPTMPSMDSHSDTSNTINSLEMPSDPPHSNSHLEMALYENSGKTPPVMQVISHRPWVEQPPALAYVVSFLHAIPFVFQVEASTACDEISVRLMVIWHSNRAWYEPTVVVWYALILLAGRRVLLGACLWAPSWEVLRHWKRGWQHLRGLSVQGSTTGCPASAPNLARLQRLCPGTTQGLATWGPMPAG